MMKTTCMLPPVARTLTSAAVMTGSVAAYVTPMVLTAQGRGVSADSGIMAYAPTDTLPTDTAVTIGTLPNGMRYYVRVNHKPEHRAELRLVVHAGSLMEDDDQRGLAHFVEHMAFRGTTHFQGIQIVEYLKSIGVAFGADLNAGTEFNNTTYILPIPTDTLAQLQKGLQIMEDWAHGVAFRPQDIEEERGIVLSERRTNLGAQKRIMDQELPVLFKGSRYAVRDPIGTEASVAHATRDQLVRFYRTWYRPDRMAVVAVGDFDKAQMIRLIREQFSQVPAPTTPNPAPTFPVPPQPGTLVSVVSDPEVPASIVVVGHKEAPYTQHTVADLRAQLVRGLFDDMLNQRFAEILNAPNAPFIQAQVGHIPIAPELGVAGFMAIVPKNGAAHGLEGVLTEADRVAQHGFTGSELEREKASYLSALANQYDNRNDQQSAALVGSYVDNFLQGDAIPSVETDVGVERHLLTTVTLADINHEAGFWNLPDNRLLVVIQPTAADIQAPDTTALLHLFQTVSSTGIAAYHDETSNEPLLPTPPTPGHIVAERHYPSTGITRWTLSNGAVVLLKPTPFKADEILFSASNPGGTSVLPDSVYPTAALMNEIATAGGVGRFSQPALDKRLSGKVVNVGAGVSGTDESLQGSSSRRDLETLLQLVYLRMTAPRYDSAAIAAFLQREAATLATQSADPGSVFGDTVEATLTQHSPRAPILTTSLLAQIHPQEAFATYRDRFVDASGFTFLFVGAIAPDSLRPLVERYLASLPARNRHEEIRDLPVFHAPPGIVHATVTAGTEPRTTTILHFSGPYEGNVHNAAEVQVLTGLLENRLNNLLRERLAGTYGVGVNEERAPRPINAYSITIQFDADPARRAELTRAVFAEIDSLQRIPPTADELHRVIAPLVRTRERDRQTNGYWLSALNLYQWGRSFDELLDDTQIASVTPARVQQAARRYLDVRHYAEFDLLPAHGTLAPAGGGAAPPSPTP